MSDYDPTATDVAEDYYAEDEFHREISRINKAQGTGRVIAIVWSDEKQTEGIKDGMVICQLNHSMVARRFTVEFSPRDYVLKFLRKSNRIESDYFRDC